MGQLIVCGDSFMSPVQGKFAGTHFSELIAKELKYVLDNKLVRKNGIIAVTIYKPIRRIKNNKSFLDVLKLFKTNFEGDSRNNINKVIERFFYAICGFNYSVELFEYKDTSPMVLALIKREI